MGAAAVGLQLFQAYGQANAEQAMGSYQNRMAKINADWANLQADRAIEKGDEEASKFLKKASSILGSQRTGFAASGVDVNYGSAQAIQRQTRELAAEDAEEIRSNAFLEAMGFKHQASEYSRSGAMALASSRTSAAQTMLGGGLKAYQQYKYGGKNA